MKIFPENKSQTHIFDCIKPPTNAKTADVP